jgi:probable HAF family extracellular repeat protein
MKFHKFAWCLALLFAASTCFAQMYTVTDLGTLGGTQSWAAGINAFGQVVGGSFTSGNATVHAFRTAANSPINPATDDLSTLTGTYSSATGINDSGQVVGTYGYWGDYAFRTNANSPINLPTDDLGTLGGSGRLASGINNSGQVVGYSLTTGNYGTHAFRTSANTPINPATDDLGILGMGSYSCNYSWGRAINASGQVAGESSVPGSCIHAFRTSANTPINPATDDLGTLGGTDSTAAGINDSGQVVGSAAIGGDTSAHAFRTSANGPINPATDDLGTLGGSNSSALGINNFGQVVGWSELTVNVNNRHAFLYNGGVMYDLNDFIVSGSEWELTHAWGINDAGQIAGQGTQNCTPYWICSGRAFLLTPIYKAFVQQPINADGSSVFKATRGVVPVKFTLTENGTSTCALPPATISVTRTAGGTLGAVDENSYSIAANSGSNFRIDTTACQYVYNLAAYLLGVGTYRLDISINGIMVGHAVFALK